MPDRQTDGDNTLAPGATPDRADHDCALDVDDGLASGTTAPALSLVGRGAALPGEPRAEPAPRLVGRPWGWWAHFFLAVARPLVPGQAAQDDKAVRFILEYLALRRGDNVLDLGCGSGEHARRLAAAGCSVVGIDGSRMLVEHCLGLPECKSCSLSFRTGDFRDDLGNEIYDACIMLGVSFGYLDESGNEKTIERVAAALRFGGRFLVESDNPAVLREEWEERRDEIASEGLLVMKRRYNRATRSYEGYFHLERPDAGKILLAQPSCPEAKEIPTGLVRTGEAAISENQARPNRKGDCDECIRLYGIDELRKMFLRQGLVITGVFSNMEIPPAPFDGKSSGRMIVMARKIG